MAEGLFGSSDDGAWQFKSLRYGGTCVACGADLARNAKGWHDPVAKKVRCTSCHPNQGVRDEAFGRAALRGAETGLATMAEPMDADNPMPPAGWYADPNSGASLGSLRYWDGAGWTSHLFDDQKLVRASIERRAAGPRDQGQGSGASFSGRSAASAEVHDLVANRPGQAARERAVELKQAAPVRTVIARALGAKSDERNGRVGADGEVEVARRLGKLGAEWRVLHAVPVGSRGSDIDHLVIGPAGVFTLNTKNHTGCKIWVAENAFLVNGQKTPYLSNSRFEAKRATELLTRACGFSPTVAPVIVVLAAEMTIKQPPLGVHVVARKKIARWLASRPPVLTLEGVDELFAAARRSTTWTSGAR